MEIKLSNLEMLLSMLIIKIKLQGITKVALKDDFYWNMDCEEKFNLKNKKLDFTIGSLVDDLQSIAQVLFKRCIPTLLDFDRLANLLVYLGDTLSKKKIKLSGELDDIEIELSDLELLLNALILKAKDYGITEVILEEDCYWNITHSDKIAITDEGPPLINIGSLVEDLQNINLVLSNKQELSFADFDRLANLLVYVGYALIKTSF